MTTFDLERMRKAVAITVTCRLWGNRRKANIESVETDTDKSRLRLTKQLIVADEYEAIVSSLGQMRSWIEARTVPSFFKKGFYLIAASGVQEIEDKLRSYKRLELPLLIADLKEAFPRKIDEARTKLNGMFRESDYPDVDELDNLFGIEHNWIAFSVPEGLPPELKQAEAEKLEANMKDAGEQITLALREGFRALVAHAADRLQPNDDGKPKVFRDTLIGNIKEFIDTFNHRNLLNDTELASMVEQARAILTNVNADGVRKSDDLRKDLQDQFTAMRVSLDNMIVTMPSRRFDLE